MNGNIPNDLKKRPSGICVVLLAIYKLKLNSKVTMHPTATENRQRSVNIANPVENFYVIVLKSLGKLLTITNSNLATK